MAPDLEALLTVLHRNDVRHVVVGGVAVGAHGVVRTTLDVDVVPDPERGNIERLVAALTQLEATIPSGKRFDPSVHAQALRTGRVCSLRHLRSMKATAGRPQHLADLDQLPDR